MGLIRWADPPYAPPMAFAPAAAAAPAASRHQDNVARHLSGISQDLQARVRHCLSEDCGYHGLRPSFGPFLSLGAMVSLFWGTVLIDWYLHIL